MKQTLQKLTEGAQLTTAEAKDTMLKITSGHFSNEEVAAFLMALNMRPWVVAELRGFRQAMVERALPIDLGSGTVDIVGTGGDGKNTFNISTCTSFVVAGAGYKVAKHGSYGVSSVSGSANVLLELGIKFTNDQTVLKDCLNEANFCFIHAPLFHPAMKHVIPIRKALKVRTVFNILGPLINPVKTSYGLYGVYKKELAPIYAKVFDDTEIEYAIVNDLDGYDEISLTHNSLIINKKEEKLLQPSYFDCEKISPDAIFGGSTVEEAANIFRSVLKHESTPEQKEVVLANAAVAIQLIEPQLSLLECKKKAKVAIESGQAYSCLQRVIEITKGVE